MQNNVHNHQNKIKVELFMHIISQNITYNWKQIIWRFLKIFYFKLFAILIIY